MRIFVRIMVRWDTTTKKSSNVTITINFLIEPSINPHYDQSTLTPVLVQLIANIQSVSRSEKMENLELIPVLIQQKFSILKSQSVNDLLFALKCKLIPRQPLQSPHNNPSTVCEDYYII